MITKATLQNKTEQQKHTLKVAEHATVKPFSYNMGGFEINIVKIGKETKGREAGLLKLVVEVTKDGLPVFIDNPLYYKNPPILVPDGTKRLETVTDPFGSTREREVDNYKIDVKEAMKAMVYETIKVTNK